MAIDFGAVVAADPSARYLRFVLAESNFEELAEAAGGSVVVDDILFVSGADSYSSE